MDINKNNLDQIATHPLQTSSWTDFRREWGNEVIETPHGIVILHKIPFLNKKIGMFIRGPEPTGEMLEFLKKFGQENNLIFVKLEPNVKKNAQLIELLKNSGARPGKTLFTPTTFWIDLNKTEEELLKGFSSKARYNIRYAQRKGVEVVEDNSDEAFEKYLELTRETVERQGFYAHNEKYHRLMWQKLKSAGVAKLLTAKYQNEILTAWIVFHWQDFIYYPYGASTDKYKNLQTNSLMMWEAIKLGKNLGAKTFDLWGREEGKGFTRFKEGFNPQVVEFIGTWDLVINKPLYNLYRILEFFRWIILRSKSKFTKPRF